MCFDGDDIKFGIYGAYDPKAEAHLRRCLEENNYCDEEDEEDRPSEEGEDWPY